MQEENIKGQAISLHLTLKGAEPYFTYRHYLCHLVWNQDGCQRLGTSASQGQLRRRRKDRVATFKEIYLKRLQILNDDPNSPLRNEIKLKKKKIFQALNI